MLGELERPKKFWVSQNWYYFKTPQNREFELTNPLGCYSDINPSTLLGLSLTAIIHQYNLPH